MDTLEFEVKTSTKTKYGFNLNFRYYVNVNWFYNKCKISIKTYYHKTIIYETTVSEENYNNEINDIQTLMENGKWKDILIKDFERCVACKKSIDKHYKWVYDEYDMFCSLECMKKPIADKCCVCEKDISRKSDWVYPLYCSIFCASYNILKIQTNLSIDIINNIINKI